MNPIPFPEATRVLGPPPSMTLDECQPLAIHDDGETMISCWSPSDEERRAIAGGAPLWLGVLGRGHPPVWIAAQSPFAPWPCGHCANLWQGRQGPECLVPRVGGEILRGEALPLGRTCAAYRQGVQHGA